MGHQTEFLKNVHCQSENCFMKPLDQMGQGVWKLEK